MKKIGGPMLTLHVKNFERNFVFVELTLISGVVIFDAEMSPMASLHDMIEMAKNAERVMELMSNYDQSMGWNNSNEYEIIFDLESLLG